MGAPRGKGHRNGAPQKASAGSFFGGGGYASHGAYMVEKNRKLKEQLAVVAGEGIDAVEKPPIFRGLTFWMTGRTCVPDQDLKRLIVEHGGTYEQYGFTRVSHIIADNLATGNQTWRELRNRVKRGHVVTSSWVVDCTEARRRIPEVRYLPGCLSSGNGLLSFINSTAPNVAACLDARASEDIPAADRHQAPALGGKGVKRLLPPTDGLGSQRHDTPDIPSSTSSSHEACDTTSPGTFSLTGMAAVFSRKFATSSGKHVFRERSSLPGAAGLDDPSQIPLGCSSVGASSSSSSSSRSIAPPKVDGGADIDSIPKTSAVSKIERKSSIEALPEERVPPLIEREPVIDAISKTQVISNDRVPRTGSRAPIWLEASASCSVGLSGLAESVSVLHDLSVTAASSLRFHQRFAIASVGLRIAIEPFEEWSHFRDLPIPLVIGCEMHDSSSEAGRLGEDCQGVAGAVLIELKALLNSASRVFGWDDNGGWSSIRRISALHSLCERDEIPASRQASRTALGASIDHASTRSMQPNTACALALDLNAPPASSGEKRAKKPRRSWRADLLKSPEELQSGRAQIKLISLVGHVPKKAPDVQRDVQDLCSQVVPASPPHLHVHATPQIEEACNTMDTPRLANNVEELSSGSQAVSRVGFRRGQAIDMIKAARKLVGSAGVVALVDELRSLSSRSVHTPGAARSLLRLATQALSGRGFQEYSAALLSLLQRRELDVVNAGLQTLRTVATNASLSKTEPTIQPVASYFNALIRDLNNTFDATMHGVRIDIFPLPEQSLELEEDSPYANCYHGQLHRE